MPLTFHHPASQWNRERNLSKSLESVFCNAATSRRPVQGPAGGLRSCSSHEDTEEARAVAQNQYRSFDGSWTGASSPATKHSLIYYLMTSSFTSTLKQFDKWYIQYMYFTYVKQLSKIRSPTSKVWGQAVCGGRGEGKRRVKLILPGMSLLNNGKDYSADSKRNII